MISHMHDDKIEGEEQLPSSIEEKQTGAPLEEQQKQTPPRPQRGREWLMRILGVALPLVGGFLISWPWFNNPQFYVLGIHIQVILLCGFALLAGLTVFVGALLLRSW